MKRTIPRIMLAAPASGSGKTMMTCGLLQACLNRGLACAAWKCGPDYIDPMFHKYVLGISGGNLDSFFLEGDEIRSLLARETPEGSLAVLEGVMGYFDGVAGTSTWASSYEVAKKTETPVILVVDGKGASLSLAALVKGFLEYKPEGETGGNGNQIKGILLNRISPMMAERLRPRIEELGVPLVGYVPAMPQLQIKSRHLGLMMPEEVGQLRHQLDLLGEQLLKTVDFDKVLNLANQAPELEIIDVKAEALKRELVIAVARDEAFCFYYQENLRLLERLGARLVDFSPLRDEKLPEGAGGVILGGGYPELYGAELSGNRNMTAAIRTALAEGMPLLAECGGFLYLHERLEAEDGVAYPMVGFIKGEGYRTKKLGRFGYIAMTPKTGTGCLQSEIKGHEFHYWDSTANGDDWQAKKPLGDREWDCVHDGGGQIAGFPHLYYPSNEGFIKTWLDAAESYGASRKGVG